MKRMLSVLLAGAAVLCAALPAAAESAGTDAGAAQTQEETMPDSVLYCGQVQGVDRDGDGAAVRLHLTSEDQGEYVMNLSPETVWIDSEAYAAFDPAALEEGETVYVFHSPVSTRSLPPQSAAYAVVRNVPQDAAAPQYHQVESVTEDGAGGVMITTDNGGLLLSAGADTVVTAYDGSAALTDLQAGDYVMAWYPLVMLSYPGQARADHLMLLPRAEESQTAGRMSKGAAQPAAWRTTATVVGMSWMEAVLHTTSMHRPSEATPGERRLIRRAASRPRGVAALPRPSRLADTLAEMVSITAASPAKSG